VAGQEVVEPPTQPGGPERELMRERTLPRVDARRGFVEGAVEPSASLGRESDVERRLAARARSDQSSIPFRGDDGTAISREGMRPAR
jgi:hypothetical protein